MTDIKGLSIAASFLLTVLSLSSPLHAAPVLYGSEVTGDSNANTFNAEDDTVYYGLGGNDKFKSCRNCESYFMGGTGNDRYIMSGSSIAFIEDNQSGKDIFQSRTMSWNKRRGRLETVVGTIDRRHLIAISASGTGVIIGNWKKNYNRIEKIKLRDGTKSYSYLRRNLRKLDGYIGNISFRQLRNEGLEYTKTDFYDTINHYKQQEQARYFSSYTLQNGFVISSNLNSDPDYRITQLSFSPVENASISFGDTHSLGTFHSGADLNTTARALSSEEDVIYSQIRGMMISAEYRLSSSVGIAANVFEQDVEHLTTYSPAAHLESGQALKLYFENSGIQLASSFSVLSESGSVFNRLMPSGVAQIRASKTYKSTTSVTLRLNQSATLSSWYEYGLASPEYAGSMLYDYSDTLSAEAWGVQYDHQGVLAKTDTLSVRIHQPYSISSGHASLKFANLLGYSDADISLQDTSTSPELSFGYRNDLRSVSYGTVVNLSGAEDPDSGRNTSEVIFYTSLKF